MLFYINIFPFAVADRSCCGCRSIYIFTGQLYSYTHVSRKLQHPWVSCSSTGVLCCAITPSMPAGISVKAVACLWQVMKAVSGKFHPIFQWFHFDSVESLPENLPLPPEEVDLQVGP